MPSTYKRGTFCKDVTQINIKITWEHIWDSYPVYIHTYLYAQIKLKKHKQIMEELPENGWGKKKSFQSIFSWPFLYRTSPLLLNLETKWELEKYFLIS